MSIALLLIGTISRLLPHPANFTAVGAVALFSGAHLKLPKALCLVFFTMLITDFILGFHAVMWATYLGMFFAVIVGQILRQKKTIGTIILATFTSAIFFFLITNFAVWAAAGSMYPKTRAGLIESYVMALPFFRNSLIGDFSYTALFFGGYEVVRVLKTYHFNKLIAQKVE